MKLTDTEIQCLMHLRQALSILPQGLDVEFSRDNGLVVVKNGERLSYEMTVDRRSELVIKRVMRSHSLSAAYHRLTSGNMS